MCVCFPTFGKNDTLSILAHVVLMMWSWHGHVGLWLVHIPDHAFCFVQFKAFLAFQVSAHTHKITHTHTHTQVYHVCVCMENKAMCVCDYRGECVCKAFSCTFMCTCMCTCTCTSTCMCMCMCLAYMYPCICLFVCLYVCIFLCMFVYMFLARNLIYMIQT